MEPITILTAFWLLVSTDQEMKRCEAESNTQLIGPGISAHYISPDKGKSFNETHPGIGIEKDGDVAYFTTNNSDNNASVNLQKEVYKTDSYSVKVGVATGYNAAPLLPTASVTKSFDIVEDKGIRMNVSLLPGAVFVAPSVKLCK